MKEIIAYLRPYDIYHDLYQQYYHYGLQLYIRKNSGYFKKVSLSRFPNILRALKRIENSYRLRKYFKIPDWFYCLLDRFARYIEGSVMPPSSFFDSAVGQYLFIKEDGKIFRICIDSRDWGLIYSKELLNWSDIYFKTNFWGNSMIYTEKVLPMFNANPIIIDKIPQIRRYRNIEKRYDLCFIVRVWGGRNEEEGIEHCLQLLEGLSDVDCKKFLLAILVCGNIREIGKRLDSRKIPWSQNPMKLKDLLMISAQSKLNIIRLGMHYCVPWRMTELLALGTCPVLDHAPYTVWPQPLLENIHFLNLDISVGPGQTLAPIEQYQKIPEKIYNWLSNSALVSSIEINSRKYFDYYLDPEKVGMQIIKKIESQCL